MVFPCARPFVHSSPFQCPTKQGHEELLTAAVERGPSEGARSGSKVNSSCPCITSSPLAVLSPNPYTNAFAIQPGLNSPARSSIS